MSVGDVNSVDTADDGVYPGTVDLQGSNAAPAAQFQAHLQLARQNMTAAPRYAFNSTPWQPNQTATDASPRFNFQQPGPQINKVPLPTNTPGRPTITPGARGLLGLFGSELGLVGAAFQQLGHMQHMIENAPVLTLDGKQFDRDAVKDEIMKQLSDADRQRLGLPPLTAGGNASDAGRQPPAGIEPTEKPDSQPQAQPTPRPGFAIETRTEEENHLAASMRAQGKSAVEIQNALDALRAGKVPPTEGEHLTRPTAASQGGGPLGRNVSIVALTREPSAHDIAAARELVGDLEALPKGVPWTPDVINSKNPQLRARLAEAGLDDLVGWEGKAKVLGRAGASEEIIVKLRTAVITTNQLAIDTPRTIIAPNGQKIELPPIASMPAEEAQQWYRQHAHQIPDFIDKTASPEGQARQAFELRNAFRNAARSALQNRNIVARALINDPDKTWDDVVHKYAKEVAAEHSYERLSDNALRQEVWKKIIGAADRTRYDNQHYTSPKSD